MDGISVHASRENMGYKLANRIMNVLTAEQLEEIDVVMVSEFLFSFDLLYANITNAKLTLVYCSRFRRLQIRRLLALLFA